MPARRGVMVCLMGSMVAAGTAAEDISNDALPLDMLEFLAEWQDEDGAVLDPAMFLDDAESQESSGD